MAKTPLWLFEIPKPRALLVVAHCDDETIFAGGLILSSHDTQWTIICCTTESAQREEEFRCACHFFERESGNPVNPILFGLTPDSHVNPAIRERVEGLLVKKLRSYAVGYDIVFTHNSEGEYGHPDHKLVHRYVVNSIGNPNTWLFISPGSTNINQDRLRSTKPGGNVKVNLAANIRRLKIRAFQECHVSQANRYGYDENGKLRNTDLRETLLWEFESGKEEYTFHR